MLLYSSRGTLYKWTIEEMKQLNKDRERMTQLRQYTRQDGV